MILYILIEKYTNDFMFQLTKEEWAVLMSQNAISNEKDSLMSQNAISNRGGRRKLPLLSPGIGDESNLSSSLSEA